MENSINNTNQFISSKDNDEVHVIHSKGDKKEIMINDKVDGIIKNLLNHSLIDVKIIWKHQ